MWRPGGASRRPGDDFYSIACELEVLHVLRGSITLRFPQGPLELGAGDTVTFAGLEPHTWVNESDAQSEVIWTIVPAAWSGSR